MPQPIDVSVIIVNWNTCSDLCNCLRSLEQYISQSTTCEVIVVDNDSKDNSSATIRSSFPSVKLIQNPTNVGFSAANNVGIRAASGRYVLLLNPDCVFIEDALTSLVELMDQDRTIGLCGCRLLNADQTEQKSVDLFPFPFQEINPGFRRARRRLLASVASAVLTGAACDVGVLIGAFQLLPRQLLVDVGSLDDTLFMYGEDLDLCYRVEKFGKRVVLVTNRSVVHLGGKSSEQVWSDVTRLGKVRQSIFLIHVKHFGLLTAITALLVRSAISWVRYVLVLVLNRSRSVRSEYAAEASATTRTFIQIPTLLKRHGLNSS